jgi:hypothetical protein
VPMDSELLQAVGTACARIAGRAPITPELIRTEIQSSDLSRWSARRIEKAIIEVGRGFRAKGHLGRLRATILMGVVYSGAPLLVQI